MIDEADRRLREWVRAVDESAEVTLEAPTDQPEGRGVSLYLLGIGERPPARGAERPPLQVWLRYLVTTWAPDRRDAQGLLLELAFAAMEDEAMQLDLEPLPADLWAALGARPQPSFLLRLPLRRERPVEAAPPVLWPLRVEPGRSIGLEGLVLGPREIPIAGASVEIPALQRQTRTDRRGRFRFARLPGPPVRTELVVRAKGRSISLTVSEPDPDRPLVVHLDPLEEGYARLPDA